MRFGSLNKSEKLLNVLKCHKYIMYASILKSHNIELAKNSLSMVQTIICLF